MQNWAALSRWEQVIAAYAAGYAPIHKDPLLLEEGILIEDSYPWVIRGKCSFLM